MPIKRGPKITQDELAAAIAEARQDFMTELDKRPVGAFTINEWADKLGLGETTMRVRMRKALADRTYEKVTVQLRATNGVMYYGAAYRKVKPKP